MSRGADLARRALAVDVGREPVRRSSEHRLRDRRVVVVRVVVILDGDVGHANAEHLGDDRMRRFVMRDGVDLGNKGGGAPMPQRRDGPSGHAGEDSGLAREDFLHGWSSSSSTE